MCLFTEKNIPLFHFKGTVRTKVANTKYFCFIVLYMYEFEINLRWQALAWFLGSVDLKTTKRTTRSWRFIPRLKILQKTLLCSTKMNHTVSREFLLRRESKKWSSKVEKVNVTESRNLILQMRILSGDVYAWNFEIMFKMDVKATIHMRFWLSQKSSPACMLSENSRAGNYEISRYA